MRYKVNENCIGCGQCAKLCPQHIDIPQAMQDLTARLTALPSWAAMCREREHEQSREKA